MVSTAELDTGAEIALRLRQQELAAEFSNFGLRTDELQPVLDEACRVAATGMECSLAKVLEFEPAEGCFVMRAGIGWMAGSVGSARLGADLESPAGYAFQTGVPVLSNHLAGETRFRTPKLLLDHGVRRAFNVLVAAPKGRYGVLEVDSPDTRDFTVADTAFLQTLAATLASAIAKQARIASVRKAEAFLAGVLDSSPDCIKVLSADGRLRFMNKRGLEMNELATDEDVLGEEFAALWPPSQRAALREAVREAAEGRPGRFSGRCPTAKGKERWWDLAFDRLDGVGSAAPQVICISRDVTDQRKAEQALREAEERYRSMFSSIDAGFCVFDVLLDDAGRCVDYRFVDVNRAFETQTGLHDVVGRCMRDLAPDHEQRWFEVYGEVARTGEPRRFEYQAQALESRIFDLYAFRIGEPEQHRVAVLFNDVSERRRGEAAVRRSEARLKAAQELAELGTYHWDLTRDLLDLDARGRQIFGLPAEGDIRSSDIFALVDPNEIERVRQEVERGLDRRSRLKIDYPILRADGARREVSSMGEMVEGTHGRPTGIFGVIADVTKRKRMVEALEALNSGLEQQVEERTRERDRAWRLSQDLMVVADQNGSIMAVNAAWQRSLGYPPGELDGRNFIEFTHPDDIAETIAAFAGLLARPLSKPYEYRFRHSDGSYRWFAWTGAFEDGQVYASGRDTTDVREKAEALRLSEEALRQAQKMEAVGQLTGGLAHDFNNLLTGVTGSLDLMQTRMRQGRFEAVERYVGAAQAAAQRAAALTHRLLAFSRRQTLEPRAIDVNVLVSGMTDMIRRTVGPAIEVETVEQGGLWTTLVDPGQLENALLNLCINARDAMPDGGRIMVEVANRDVDQGGARDRDMPAGEYVCMSVSDTGSGMPADVIAKAFDPFFTTKPIGQGTGLGLSMIYGFARQSGGQVRIHSEVGRGTTVSLFLPKHRGAIEEIAPGAERILVPRAAAGSSVLVVDDEATVRMLVMDVLADLGYDALEAADGPSGLTVLRSAARIDLLITDVGLPGGMNGRQLADAARVARPDLKVLFITGYAEVAVLGHGHLDPGMHVMTKPFAMNALASRISDLVGGHAPPSVAAVPT